MKVKTFCSMLFVVAMLLTAPLELSARTLGMVADGTIFEDNKFKVSVFNADTNAVLGTVDIPATDFFLGGTAITPDLKRGFVANNKGEVFVIDLTTPPRLATGTNPISISNNRGVAMSISPNGKFLVVAGGGSDQPISVIDIATRTEISTFPILPIGSNATAMKVCSDNSVLVVVSDELFESHSVRRLTLSGAGTLTDTGEVLSVNSLWNVHCAPSAQSGVVITLDGEVKSFSVPGLRLVENRPVSGVGVLTGAISEDRMVVLTGDVTGGGLVDVFRFTQATGALSAKPLLTIPVTTVNAYISGVDQIALHPNGKKLYVAERGAANELCAVDKPCAVNVYDLRTGAFIASITDPAIVQPLSITVVEADPCAGPPPRGSIKGNNRSNILNGTRGNDKIFGFGGNDKINGKGGNDLICGGSGNDTIVAGSGNDRVNGNAGYDRINGGPGRDRCTGEVLRRCNP